MFEPNVAVVEMHPRYLGAVGKGCPISVMHFPLHLDAA
jgi:hypothetical protein